MQEKWRYGRDRCLFFLGTPSSRVCAVFANENSFPLLLPPSFSPTGLKYEDLLVETDDVEKSLKRIPHDVLVERCGVVRRYLLEEIFART